MEGRKSTSKNQKKPRTGKQARDVDTEVILVCKEKRRKKTWENVGITHRCSQDKDREGGERECGEERETKEKKGKGGKTDVPGDVFVGKKKGRVRPGEKKETDEKGSVQRGADEHRKNKERWRV